MSLIVTQDAFEEACGTCSVCGEEEIETFLLACGHWACQGCCYSFVDDAAGILDWVR